jgi:predicted Zn-dependent protease with MMP-like domain
VRPIRRRMQRERFVEVVAQVLDNLPQQFRSRMQNVAVLVEDLPRQQRIRAGRPHGMGPRELLMGVFVGTPRTQKSVFDLSTGPDHIILYQKNIEAVCRDETEIREQIRLTIIHEIGHYFGMDEEQLRDV